MKLVWGLLAVVSIFLSCGKSEPVVTTTPPPQNSDTPVVSPDTFTRYRILKGKNYCENNSYLPFRQRNLKFKAIFDSSCIYKNADPVNQADINKLYGFSDCSTLHHANSARFGWNWLDGAIHIHAYCYADSIRSYKEIGTVNLNQEIECSITVLPGKYIFSLNGKEESMVRHCSDTSVSGVKLLPYFGGDEPSPQDITIRIKEIK